MNPRLSLERESSEIEDFYFLEKKGWEVVEDHIGLFLLSPEQVRFSKKDLTEPKGLKFGDYGSLLRLEAVRFYYLYKKYSDYF